MLAGTPPCLRVYQYKFKQQLPTGPLGSASLCPFLCLFLQQAASESSARDQERCPVSTPACVSACPIAFTFTCNLGAYAGPFFCILCVCLDYVCDVKCMDRSLNWDQRACQCLIHFSRSFVCLHYLHVVFDLCSAWADPWIGLWACSALRSTAGAFSGHVKLEMFWQAMTFSLCCQVPTKELCDVFACSSLLCQPESSTWTFYTPGHRIHFFSVLWWFLALVCTYSYMLHINIYLVNHTWYADLLYKSPLPGARLGVSWLHRLLVGLSPWKHNCWPCQTCAIKYPWTWTPGYWSLSLLKRNPS